MYCLKTLLPGDLGCVVIRRAVRAEAVAAEINATAVDDHSDELFLGAGMPEDDIWDHHRAQKKDESQVCKVLSLKVYNTKYGEQRDSP
jgi:hypothetical protein